MQQMQYWRNSNRWINPITDEGGGAFPFRTGISTVRIALADITEKLKANE